MTVATSCGALTGIGEIDNDEAGQVRKGDYGFREISACRFVEVEDNRQVIVLPKFLSESIEDCLSLKGEFLRVPHDLGRDGVNYITKFFVVQKQVDELSNFEIIDCDGWRTRRVTTRFAWITPSNCTSQMETP